MADLPEGLFPPCLRFSALIDLLPARGARKRKKKKKQPPRRSQMQLFLTYLCVCFWTYSIVFPIAGFPVVRSVAFRSHCELHDNCVSTAPRRDHAKQQRKKNIRIWNEPLYACDKFTASHKCVRGFHPASCSRCLSAAPRQPAAATAAAELAEYYIWPAGVRMSLWATGAGRRRPSAAALRGEEGEQRGRRRRGGESACTRCQ